MLQYTYDRVAAEKDKQMMLSNAAHKARIRLLLLIGAALLLITGLVFYFRRRIEKNKYHLEMASLRQAALNAQMSDHFIGNSMDSINGFIQNNDKAKASDYLTRFSKLIRNVLVNSQEKLVPIEDDLEVLKGYMELESLRFPDGGLTYDIVVDKTIDISQTLIPPMVLQILVENSIKHGFRSTDSGKVIIEIQRKGHMIECKVEDNGRGIDASPNSTSKRISIGGSLAERLVRTAGHNNRNTTYSTINILNSQSKPIGTAVQFSIPYAITD
jgi:LytS/YehU family sensor histidine kinase